MIWKIRTALARWLLGGSFRSTVEIEAHKLYDEVWPKHEDYKEQTLKSYRIALLRARLHQ